MKVRKHPLVAFLMTLSFPGFGWAYLGEIKFGIIHFVTIAITIISLYAWGYSSLYSMTAHLLLLLVVQAYSATKAFVVARRADSQEYRWYTHGIILMIGAIGLTLATEPLFKLVVVNNSRYLPVSNPSMSMVPNIIPGDRYVLDKGYFKKHRPVRGELAAFESPTDYSMWITKRIVGLPGEAVEMRQGVLYINDMPESGHYEIAKFSSETTNVNDEFNLYNMNRIILEDDQIFCIGDNRPMSEDCRTYGPVRIRNLVGKPTFIYWSGELSRLGQSLK